jgi:hypothetical protein
MPERGARRLAENELMRLLRTIIRGDEGTVTKLLAAQPSLARQAVGIGATREASADFFFHEINHYIYAGDTPLHAAAAGYRVKIAQLLLNNGADVAQPTAVAHSPALCGRRRSRIAPLGS